MSLALIMLSFKSSFIKMQHLSYSFDPRIAASTAHEIKFAIADLIKQQTTPEQLSKYLMEQWPCIYSVAVAQTMPKTIHVSIIARTPWVCINEKKILTTDSLLVNQSQFVASVYDALPVVRIAKEMEKERFVSTQLTTTISHCYSLLTDFNLVFNSDIQILLYDKQDQRFAIVCAANQLPDATTIERCSRIKDDLAQRGKLNQSLSRVWLVDTRFSNQIIVSADHGGGSYGTYCV